MSNFELVDMTIRKHQFRADALIEVLHKAQQSRGFLDSEVLLHIARGLKLPPSRVYGVATFYHLFSLEPKALHSCVVCIGSACHIRGANHIKRALENKLINNQQISLTFVRCLGACGIAPIIVIDGEIKGKQTIESALLNIQQKCYGY